MLRVEKLAWNSRVGSKAKAEQDIIEKHQLQTMKLEDERVNERYCTLREGIPQGDKLWEDIATQHASVRENITCVHNTQGQKEKAEWEEFKKNMETATGSIIRLHNMMLIYENHPKLSGILEESKTLSIKFKSLQEKFDKEHLSSGDERKAIQKTKVHLDTLKAVSRRLQNVLTVLEEIAQIIMEPQHGIKTANSQREADLSLHSIIRACESIINHVEVFSGICNKVIAPQSTNAPGVHSDRTTTGSTTQESTTKSLNEIVDAQSWTGIESEYSKLLGNKQATMASIIDE